MKEQDLIDLGFERTDVPSGEWGDEAFYYYRYEITDELCLISSGSDEFKKSGLYVELCEYGDIEITNLKGLKTLIGIVERNKKKREEEDIDRQKELSYKIVFYCFVTGIVLLFILALLNL